MTLPIERIEELRAYAQDKKEKDPWKEGCWVDPNEMLALLDSARALARLERIHARGGWVEIFRHEHGWSVDLCSPERTISGDERPTIDQSLNAALDAAEGEEE